MGTLETLRSALSLIEEGSELRAAIEQTGLSHAAWKDVAEMEAALKSGQAMSSLIPAADLARRYGFSPRAIANRCAAGKIPGAVRIGRYWAVPDSTVISRESGGWPLGRKRKS